MRVRAGVLAAAMCCLLAIAGGTARAQVEPCKAKRLECSLVTVPLDRSGGVPGTVRLRVERQRTKLPTSHSPLFVFDGFPGTSSRAVVADALRYDSTFEELGRNREVVAMDLRGTGRSGVLSCGRFQYWGREATDAAARCAAALGPRRAFYTARESVEDIEFVRQTLGFDKITLFGSSYGASVAFAYAQRYPQRVDRLLLVAIPGPHGFDALYRPGLANTLNTVQVLCRKSRCQHATDDPFGDVSRLARRLERTPIAGTVLGKAGRPHRVRVHSFDLFQALTSALGGDRRVMGLVRNAVRGDVRPLLRYQQQARNLAGAIRLPESFFSPAALAASMCEEAQLPWSRATPVEGRRDEAHAFVRGLPPDSLQPFGPRAALGSDIVRLCRGWPIASAPPPAPAPLPQTPALIIAGVDDSLAPVSSARGVANLIPGSRILRLRGAVLSPIGGYGGWSSCATGIIERFLAGQMPTDTCGPEWQSERGAAKPPPLSIRELDPDPRVRGRLGRTLRAVNATVRDGAEILTLRFFVRFFRLMQGETDQLTRRQVKAMVSGPIRTGGLRRGSYALRPFEWRLTMRNASYVPGVRLSGWLILADEPEDRRGVIHVRGPGAPNGRLTLRHGVLSGRLGGRFVEAPSRFGSDIGFGAFGSVSDVSAASSALRRLLPPGAIAHVVR